jgi:hypothetical protein
VVCAKRSRRRAGKWAYVFVVKRSLQPRITLLNEMAPTSEYFFLDPDYSAKETVALYETVESETYGETTGNQYHGVRRRQ